MPITVKKAALWRTEMDNHPGALASALGPLAQAGADLQVVMAYRNRGNEKGVVEVHPITGGSRLPPRRLPVLPGQRFPSFSSKGTIGLAWVTRSPRRLASPESISVS